MHTQGTTRFFHLGFGDIYPKSPKYNVLIILYMALGMAVMSTFLETLGSLLRKIHYLGRKFHGAKNVDVWFGAQTLSVCELLTVIADQFAVSPEQLRGVLRKLDVLVEAALMEKARLAVLENADLRRSRANSTTVAPNGLQVRKHGFGTQDLAPTEELEMLEVLKLNDSAAKRLQKNRKSTQSEDSGCDSASGAERQPEVGDVLEALTAIASYSMLSQKGRRMSEPVGNDTSSLPGEVLPTVSAQIPKKLLKKHHKAYPKRFNSTNL